MEEVIKQIEAWVEDIKYDLNSPVFSESEKNKFILQIMHLEQAKAMLGAVGGNDNIKQ